MGLLRGMHAFQALTEITYASPVQLPLVRQVGAIQGLRMARYRSGMNNLGSLKT